MLQAQKHAKWKKPDIGHILLCFHLQGMYKIDTFLAPASGPFLAGFCINRFPADLFIGTFSFPSVLLNTWSIFFAHSILKGMHTQSYTHHTFLCSSRNTASYVTIE